MKKKHTNSLIGLVLLLVLSSCSTKNEISKPPLAPKQPTVDEYFGQKIEDPYRNLENLKDSTVIHWLKAQKTYADSVLQSIPGRHEMAKKLGSLDRKREFSNYYVRYTKQGKYYYVKSKVGEKKHQLYYRDSLNGKEQLVYDPSTYSDKEEYQINGVYPSWDGEKVAIALSKKALEDADIVIVEAKTGKILSENITKAMPGMAGIHWLSDDSGIMYLYCPVIDPTNNEYWLNTETVVHKIGNDPTKPIPIFSKRKNPELKLQPEDFCLVYNYYSENGYVYAIVGGSDNYYDGYYKKETDLLNDTPWIPFFKKEDKIKIFRTDTNGDVYFITAKDTEYRKLGVTSMSDINFSNPKILVPERKNRMLTSLRITSDGLYFSASINGIEENMYKLEKGKEVKIKLPKQYGNINIQSISPSQNFIKISATGILSPIEHHIYDLDKHTFSPETIVEVIAYPEFNNIVVENFEIPSHDGELVPVTLIHRSDVKKDGNNHTLFYGYGSYGGDSSVSFNSNFLTWVETGGILVIAYVRGGGQKGEKWHKAGFKTTKPNTWKDMIATTEYIIGQGYTNPEKSIIWGSSAGGIMAGRAMTERPDLYKVVLLTSPALNMLRSEIQPNGQNSIKEFGTVKIEKEFKALLEMDSYHQLQPNTKYPATFVTGGIKDGRVAVWDHAKFFARLLELNSSSNPVIFDIEFDEGHTGMGYDDNEGNYFYGNAFAFALWQTGHPDYQPE